jgi:hypothetical protein
MASRARARARVDGGSVGPGFYDLGQFGEELLLLGNLHCYVLYDHRIETLAIKRYCQGAALLETDSSAQTNEFGKFLGRLGAPGLYKRGPI